MFVGVVVIPVGVVLAFLGSLMNSLLSGPASSEKAAGPVVFLIVGGTGAVLLGVGGCLGGYVAVRRFVPTASGQGRRKAD